MINKNNRGPIIILRDHHNFFHRIRNAKGIWFHIAGILAMFWFLFRVLPAPHRSQYPCQQVAIPIAFGYTAFWSALLSGSFIWLRHYKTKTIAFAPAVLIVCILLFSITGPGYANQFNSEANTSDPWIPIPKQPIGTPTGLNPGRVVWVWDPNATDKELNGYWWESQNNNQEIINEMFSNGVLSLADATCESEAWNLLFRYFNKAHDKGDVGYVAGEKIAIKINLNNCWIPYSIVDDYTWKDNELDANPSVVIALIRKLVDVVGVAEQDITVYDASRPMANWFYDPVSAVFPNVHYVDTKGISGRELVQPSDMLFYFSDGITRTLPTCVSEAEYLINMPLLKHHPINNGVTLSGKNLFGSFIEPVVDIHPYHEFGQIMGNPAPQTDLLSSENLGGKTLLYIGDGLYATLNDHRAIFWFHMYPFNDDWTNSLFFSQDPVAIDSVMYDFLHTEGPNPIQGSQNYLHQAAEPSPNTYDPEGDGSFLSKSLGVHEHWDSEIPIFSKERYSGTSAKGIDFVSVGSDNGTSSVVIYTPMEQKLYVFGHEQPIKIYWKIFYKVPETMVIGPLTVKAVVNGIDLSQVNHLEFYLDKTLQYIDNEPPFSWEWTKPSFGQHTIIVQANIYNGAYAIAAQRTVLKIL